jgi:hypothetical protein
MTDGREVTTERLEMQQWNIGPRRKTSRKQDGIQEDRQAEFRAGGRKASSQDFHRVAERE